MPEELISVTCDFEARGPDRDSAAKSLYSRMRSYGFSPQGDFSLHEDGYAPTMQNRWIATGTGQKMLPIGEA
jgi:hypothetical protein